MIVNRGHSRIPEKPPPKFGGIATSLRHWGNDILFVNLLSGSKNRNITTDFNSKQTYQNKNSCQLNISHNHAAQMRLDITLINASDHFDQRYEAAICSPCYRLGWENFSIRIKTDDTPVGLSKRKIKRHYPWSLVFSTNCPILNLDDVTALFR